MLRLDELDDGRKHYIAEEEFDYYRARVPRAVGPFTWDRCRWSFGVAGPDAALYAFGTFRHWWTGRTLYFAQKTDRLDPRACGRDLDAQYWSNPFTHRPGW
jgi:hypothetical protein